jgi:hypothetical protein
MILVGNDAGELEQMIITNGRVVLKAICASVIAAIYISMNQYAYGASITFLQGNDLAFEVQNVDTSAECSLKISGKIESGDLQKVEVAIEQDRNQNRFTIVCLDSSGGSYVEASKIVKLFRYRTIPTKVDRNGVCLSACALIFLAGSHSLHEGPVVHWRVMHPSSKIGFHSPFIEFPDKNYTKDDALEIFTVALESISLAIDSLMTNDASKYSSISSISPSLLKFMIETQPDDMFFLNTIDDVQRWDISVDTDITVENISGEDFWLACRRAELWADDRSAKEVFASNPEYKLDESYSPVSFEQKDQRITRTFVQTNDMDATGCRFTIWHEESVGWLAIDADFGSFGSGFSEEFKPYIFFDPATKIVSLPNARGASKGKM